MVNRPVESGAVRIDAWAWAVRLFKTRTAAAQAVRAGHVKVNGLAVKPAQQVVVGDTVRAWVNHREIIVEVTQLHSKRVGPAMARVSYVDHSPPPPAKEVLMSIPRRTPGAGHPTKKERRQLEKMKRLRLS